MKKIISLLIAILLLVPLFSNDISLLEPTVPLSQYEEILKDYEETLIEYNELLEDHFSLKAHEEFVVVYDAFVERYERLDILYNAEIENHKLSIGSLDTANTSINTLNIEIIKLTKLVDTKYFLLMPSFGMTNGSVPLLGMTAGMFIPRTNIGVFIDGDFSIETFNIQFGIGIKM